VAAVDDPNFNLLRDLAVASLVPTMGRVINLPADPPPDADPESDSASESVPHRLLRVGHAPAIVERPPAGSAPPAAPAPAPEPQPAGPRAPRTVLPPELASRLTTGRPVVDGVVSGPLPLLQGLGQEFEPDDLDDPLNPAFWNDSLNRGDIAALVAKAPAAFGRRSDPDE
jgi:hypothetical protein